MKIGMFDSGVGGLTLLHEALHVMPDEAYFYYADSDHVPYGIRDKEEVAEYSDEAVEFLLEQGCEAIVIACNTATSVAANLLRGKYSVPIIGVEPAVKPAVEMNSDGRILVIATPITVREKKFRDLLDRVDDRHKVDMLALPELVSFAERGEFDSESVSSYISKELDKYISEHSENDVELKDYDILVFGCTHFNHFERALRPFFKKELIMIDGAEGTIRNLQHIMSENGAKSEGNGYVRYFVSGREVTGTETAAFYEKLLQHLDAE